MNKSFFIIIFLLSVFNLSAQKHQLTLEDVINIAKERSPDALKAKHQFRSDYWSFKTYKRSMLPQLSFEGTIPSLQRAFTKYTTSTGTEAYVSQQYISYSGNLVLNQKVGLTGGNVFVSSGLQRIDNYYDTTSTQSYLSTPINIGFSQPLFNYNPYRWNKKIEPIKYEKAERSYIESMEQVALTSVGYYFDLLAAEVNLKIVDLNVANYDTLFQIAKGRYQSGKIAENELLQLELSLLKSKSERERIHLNYENVLYKFKSYLRIKDDLEIELLLPQFSIHQKITYDDALEKALIYNPKILEFEQRILEAKANLNRSKTENGFNANFYAVFGLTQNAAILPDAYVNPNDQQQVTVGVQVPILDWGMRKGQVKMAESRMDLISESIDQERIDFNQSIFMRVAEYNMQQNQLMIAAKSDTVAYKSYDVTKKRYYLGKITVTDLNIAQTNMDASKLSYIRTLQNFWQTYYLLRKSTLFDFKNSLPIEVNFEEIYR
jgi:outer membrane protein TolC